MRYSRHLEIDQFLKEISELKIMMFPPRETVLERLEQQRILIPKIRLRYPDPIERRWYAKDRPGYRRPRPIGPKEPNGPRWKAACALEKARQGRGWWKNDDPLDHSDPLDNPKQEWKQFIQFPARRKFVPWTNFRVRVDGKRGGPKWHSRTVITYYSSWQLLLFMECHDMGTSYFGNTEDWDWSSGEIPDSWSGGGIQFEPIRSLRSFRRFEKALDAVVWFTEEDAKSDSYILMQSGHHGRRQIEDHEHSEMERRSIELARRCRARFRVNYPQIIELVKFLCARWGDWERIGYAATIHKAQGVTVDRTHVLATPGLDRHSSYVALSRHRTDVQLHYGHDDFADAGKLARTLSRERAKDMASDYAREGIADPSRSFAERRGITFRERVAEIVRKIVPEKARSIFAGFRPAPEAQQDTAAERKAKTGTLDIGRGVERYARAEQDFDRMQQKGFSPMPHQEAAREKAHTALNTLMPNAGRDLALAFSRQPELISEAASGRTTNAIRAMQLESEIRTNPQMRADRFVSDWQRLHRQRELAFDAGKYSHANAATSSMGAMAKQLERDPQVDSLLRNRKIELGLHTRGSGGIGRELTEYLGLGRGRGIGIGM